MFKFLVKIYLLVLLMDKVDTLHVGRIGPKFYAVPS